MWNLKDQREKRSSVLRRDESFSQLDWCFTSWDPVSLTKSGTWRALLDHIVHAITAFTGGQRSCLLRGTDSSWLALLRWIMFFRLGGGGGGVSLRGLCNPSCITAKWIRPQCPETHWPPRHSHLDTMRHPWFLSFFLSLLNESVWLKDLKCCFCHEGL